jgi:hypothetical protein
MGSFMLIGAVLLVLPLLVLGISPLSLVMASASPGKSRPLWGIAAGSGLFLLMHGLAWAVLRNVRREEVAVLAMLWTAGWLLVSLGTCVSFGVLVARVADRTPGMRLLQLLVLPFSTWPLSAAALLLPWRVLDGLGMLFVMGLSALSAPLGVALAALSARKLPAPAEMGSEQLAGAWVTVSQRPSVP